MGKIKVMDEILANKIAAGEVVEKCVSVVKELVENSIDAKSTIIKIELVESGVKEIKVTDNGIGMDREDALLAFSSHATSKIYNDDDLYRISSLGFRGEALPSIASVSEVCLKTSTGDIGSIINIKGGKIINDAKGDARQGTVILVKNIFYNTPARLKHLSSLYTELANISDYINKIALSHPNVAFTLINDSKTLFKTDGSGNQLKVIKAIYGIDITKKMLEINAFNDDYEISGYISYPEVTKSNRNHMITIVNGRVVKNIDLNRVINNTYHTYKPEDRYPIVVLNIKVDSTLVDVNIHPAKLDIKFSKFEELKDLVKSTINEKLSSINLIPKIEVKESTPQYSELTLDFERTINEEEKQYNNIDEQNAEVKGEKETIIDIRKNKIPEMYPVGLVKGTYIVAQNDEGMYLIDHHAAEERINYEYYVKKLGNPKQDVTEMLIPINIELPNNEYLIIKEHFALLKTMGFAIDELGLNTLTIRSHPIWLPSAREEEAIRKIIDLLVVKEKEFNLEKFNEALAIMLSCKLSVKANQNISINEMESLLSRLRNCQNPYTCPHGRPVIIFYSNYELEKLFKRAM